MLNLDDPLDSGGEVQHLSRKVRGLKLLQPILEENLLTLGKRIDQLSAELEQNIRNIRTAQHQLSYFSHSAQPYEQHIAQTLTILENHRSQLGRELMQALKDWEVVHQQLNHFPNLIQELEQAIVQSRSANENNACLCAINAVRDFLSLMYTFISNLETRSCCIFILGAMHIASAMFYLM